jgi:superfamily II DNA or RNA helicase
MEILMVYILGADGRDYQLALHESLRDEKLTLVNACTGSGKTLQMLAHACDGSVEKVNLIVAPLLSIVNQIGLNYKGESIQLPGIKKAKKISITHVLQEDSTNKTTVLPEALRKAKLGDIIVCSHATFINSWEKILEDETILNKIRMYVDEAHHSNAEVDDKGNAIGTSLGAALTTYLNKAKDPHLHLYSATPFRSDEGSLLPEVWLDQFTHVMFPYSDHLKVIGVESLTSTHVCFEDLRELENKVEAILKQDTTIPTILFIPAAGSKGFRGMDTNQKEVWVTNFKERVARHYKQGNEEGNRFIADFVSSGEADNFKPEETKLLISCGKAKEGFDWPECARVINLVDDSFYGASIQKLGRMLRQHPDKKDLNYYIFLPTPYEKRKQLDQTEVTKRLNEQMKTQMGLMEFYCFLDPSETKGLNPKKGGSSRFSSRFQQIASLLGKDSSNTLPRLKIDLHNYLTNQGGGVFESASAKEKAVETFFEEYDQDIPNREQVIILFKEIYRNVVAVQKQQGKLGTVVICRVYSSLDINVVSSGDTETYTGNLYPSDAFLRGVVNSVEPWTKKEYDLLKELSGKGLTPEQIAEHVMFKGSRTSNAIQKKLSKLGLVGSVGPKTPWSKDENKLLEELHSKGKAPKDMAEHVMFKGSRTYGAINFQLSKLGLVNSVEPWSKDENKLLEELYKKGKAPKDMAEHVMFKGQRTLSALKNRLHLLKNPSS